MISEEGFIEIYRPGNHQEVALIHAALGSTDIRYFIDNENYFQATGALLGFADTWMKLMVESGRATDARTILENAGLGKPNEETKTS